MGLTIQSYVKNLALQQKWQQRQEQGLAAGAQLPSFSPAGEAGESSSQSSSRRNAIAAKLKAGKRLSPGELAWLQQNDPQLYSRARQAQRERDMQRNALLRCRSREQAGQVYRSFSQWAACDAVSAVRKATTASEGMEISEAGQIRQSALREEYSLFKRSAAWKRLPLRKGARRPGRPGLWGRLA